MNQSSDIDAKVEILKKKYLEKTPLTDAAETTDHKSTHNVAEKVMNTAWKSPTSRCYYREIKSHNKNLQELLKAVTHFPLRLDSERGLDESDDVLNIECTHSMSEPNIQCTETDVTLPSNFRAFSSPSETEHLDERPKSQRQPSPYSHSSALGLGHVYQELLEIYEKLQVERLNQQQWAAKLLKQEQKLEQRENLLLQHQETLHNVCGVQGEVHGRIHALQQQHQIEFEQLNFALKEKTKESKRLKSSFVTIKDLNESMKKQLTDLGEQKKKLEDQLKKVQARLQNLQRKYDYAVAHKGQGNVCPKIELKPSRPDKTDKTVPAVKLAKIPGSSTSGKLLALLLDWVLDSQLVQTVEGDGKSSPFLLDMPPSATSLHERCAKTLPVLTEQLQQATETHSPLQLLLLKVSYWSLRQLDQSSQTPLTSTLRRLGEEMTKGSLDPSVPSKSRPCPLFKTPCLHTRFLSTLIILKTISQVDTLAQALEALLVELRTEEGQALFLHYQALPVVSALLRGGSPGLLASALDILMLMCGESWMQTRFLEACSTEDFFRTASLLLRNPRLELPLLEKVTMLLQRLSAIRKNKRLFEAFSLHLVLQEKYRTVDPLHTFLRINLSSILFNLGMLTRP
ncbi:coiled-coil domain-containing protein 138-like isoform X1 [Alosa sapidissima]|uniref:coiled-coil domain-containing protein 138-like isoform X1 n=2 Tax=Alosa sapidissima TaxID=34773 RepID=UPI001C09A183|nr:coiled-coil domain-containing protein 138-like isoform X1 [Alosa sapidissima]